MGFVHGLATVRAFFWFNSRSCACYYLPGLKANRCRFLGAPTPFWHRHCVNLVIDQVGLARPGSVVVKGATPW
jgi:hypothetical protein